IRSRTLLPHAGLARQPAHDRLSGHRRPQQRPLRPHRRRPRTPLANQLLTSVMHVISQGPLRRLPSGKSKHDGTATGVTFPATPHRIATPDHQGDLIMIARSPIVMATVLLATLIGAPVASAVDIMRGGKPAELTVASAAAHSVRVTLKATGAQL